MALWLQSVQTVIFGETFAPVLNAKCMQCLWIWKLLLESDEMLALTSAPSFLFYKITFDSSMLFINNYSIKYQ